MVSPSDTARALRYRSTWYWVRELSYEDMEEIVPGLWDLIADLATGG